jgi:hypothetical protein
MYGGVCIRSGTVGYAKLYFGVTLQFTPILFQLQLDMPRCVVRPLLALQVSPSLIDVLFVCVFLMVQWSWFKPQQW